MIKSCFLFFLVPLFLSCNSHDENKAIPEAFVEVGELKIPVYDFSNFDKLYTRNNDTIYIYNFWATWCAPCVQELPVFEEFNSENEDERIQVILVNLDMTSAWDRQLPQFILNKNIQNKIVVLHETDGNLWIPQIEVSWDGSIPFTMVKRGRQKVFHRGILNKEQLLGIVSNFQR
jgi:thiol-disulfide isomerase/thioredoxin